MDTALERLFEKYRSHLVIVEGPKDRAALEHFGFTQIIILNKPLYQIVEEVAATNEKTVLILTDLDPKGKELYGYLSTHLKKHGINVDDTLRNYLFKETALRQIEGLVTYVSKQ